MAQDSSETTAQLAQMEKEALKEIARLMGDLRELLERKGEERDAQTTTQVQGCLNFQETQLGRIREIRAGLRQAVDPNEVVLCVGCEVVIPAKRVFNLAVHPGRVMLCVACQEVTEQQEARVARARKGIQSRRRKSSHH